MATDVVWMTNTGTGPIAVPAREVEGKLLRGWVELKQPAKKVLPKKPKKE